MLDIEGALWFLALDNALINNDGYWTRSSDYNISRDEQGKFHIIPHDANETFQPAMAFGFGGPGGPGGPGFGAGGPGRRPGGPAGKNGPPGKNGPQAKNGPPGKNGPQGRGANFGGGPPRGGVDLDPLIGLDDTRKPLRSRLLAVPALKARYMEHVRTIAQDWLDWQKLKPIVEEYRALIEKEIESDTRKLSSLAAFQKSVGEIAQTKAEPGRGRPNMNLQGFAEQRRKYLLDYHEKKNAKP